MKPMTIGQVARMAGVGVETIRFYEREGLVSEPARLESGYRQYNPDVVRRIRFIRHAKDLGFTLREIRDLLKLRVNPDCNCDDVLQITQRKLADVERRINDLQRIQAVLSKLAEDCRSRQSTDACPILASMEEQGGDAP